jgi:hypothetical protein
MAVSWRSFMTVLNREQVEAQLPFVTVLRDGIRKLVHRVKRSVKEQTDRNVLKRESRLLRDRSREVRVANILKEEKVII